MNQDSLQIVRASPEWIGSMLPFFERIANDSASGQFHPHPFDANQARKIANYVGRDLYYLAVADGVLGYGMLRGWDAGYSVPSLGIAIDPAWRGRGIARVLMHFLHAAAKVRGCREIRLKVYPDNLPAKTLYESLGYRFDGDIGDQLLGILQLERK